jgi:hypothetical protein
VSSGLISVRNTWSGITWYSVRLFHELLEDDTDIRLQFWKLFPNENSPDILMKVISPDQVNFKLSGHVNKHNCVYVRMLLTHTLRLKPSVELCARVCGGKGVLFPCLVLSVLYFWKKKTEIGESCLQDDTISGLKLEDRNFEETLHGRQSTWPFCSECSPQVFKWAFYSMVIKRSGCISGYRNLTTISFFPPYTIRSRGKL